RCWLRSRPFSSCTSRSRLRHLDASPSILHEPLGANGGTAERRRTNVKIRWTGLLWLVCALVVAGFAGPAAADDGWQDEVHLRPESVEALLGNSRDGQAGSAPQSPSVGDTSSYRDVTVAHDAGG